MAERNLPESESRRIQISAILDTFLYLGDDMSIDTDGSTLKQIISKLEEQQEYTEEGSDYYHGYCVLKEAVQDPDIGNIVIKDPSWSGSLASEFTGEGKYTKACVAESPDGDCYVAYRGTADGEWPDNARGMTQTDTNQQKEASRYFDLVASLNDWTESDHIYITGHSKGGNKAQYVTLNAENANLIDSCYSMDGQGFSPEGIQAYKERLGEEEYARRIEKMFSICGYNDYVNELGISVIPDSNTYYIKTPEFLNDLKEHHDITYFFAKKGENGTFEFNHYDLNPAAAQGIYGELAERLSKEVMNLPPEERDACAITMMSIMEIGNRYNWGGIQDPGANIVDISSFIDFGIPVIVKSLFFTPEGLNFINAEGVNFIYSFYEKYRWKGLVGLIAGTVSWVYTISNDEILKQIKRNIRILIELIKGIGDIWNQLSDTIQQFIDNCINLIEEFAQEIGNWLEEFFNRHLLEPISPLLIDGQKINLQIEELETIARFLEQTQERILDIKNNLGFKITVQKQIGLNLWMLAQKMENHGNSMKRLKQGLEAAVSEYEITEKTLASTSLI